MPVDRPANQFIGSADMSRQESPTHNSSLTINSTQATWTHGQEDWLIDRNTHGRKAIPPWFCLNPSGKDGCQKPCFIFVCIAPDAAVLCGAWRRYLRISCTGVRLLTCRGCSWYRPLTRWRTGLAFFFAPRWLCCCGPHCIGPLFNEDLSNIHAFNADRATIITSEQKWMLPYLTFAILATSKGGKDG